MSRRVAVAVAVLALALACDSAGTEDLPDLTGLYSLVSHTVNGVTETPPRVSAVLELSRQATEDGQAIGAVRFEMRRQGPNGAFSVGSGEGAYAHWKNGEMVMELRGHPFEGEFGLRGDTLTTVLVSVPQVSEQALYHSPRGKLVWVLDAVP
ncbi:MAG: hypothetical protein OXL34_09550 [Gemmatimonadota bacterium]|nr:hypothetical protein [Gemmatimonadota bacterium]